MKAVDTNLLELLKKSTQFIVPIYQRVYSWGEPECQQLWDDVVRAGERDDLANHFTGSIVYIERDQGTTTAAEPDLIIDGQQRVATVTLLLAALAQHLGTLPQDQQEPVEGFSPVEIRENYLTNVHKKDDKFFKLLLSKGDRDALRAIVRGAPIPETESRIPQNFGFLADRLSRDDVDLAAVCRGLTKLVVVDVKLTRGVDDPQLVFESMNSTGKKLSHADLIRNFVLMDLTPVHQERSYEDYWFPMERGFSTGEENQFDNFVRYFLTLKTDQIPRADSIYEAFKSYSDGQQNVGKSRDEIVIDLAKHADWFFAVYYGKGVEPRLSSLFAEIRQLTSVAYPFLLRLYSDLDSGVLSPADFAVILEAMVSYVFRRIVCQIPTNSHLKTFQTLGSAIDPDNYAESVCGRLLTLQGRKRFPTDAEFSEALRIVDLYNLRKLRQQFFRKMENFGRKEEVSIADYSIEHILPQNENLSADWQRSLGPNWKEVQERLLHTLGNLTLTGYNPEYSDKPFPEKRDMVGGFKDSPLFLNKGLGQIETWNEDEIDARARRLAARAVTIWKRPELDDATLIRYREKFSGEGRFDWSLTHAILEAIPQGKWTSYYAIAEAVGTAAQAVGNHMASCGMCPNPWRVLTWDGRVAENFQWLDPNDDRNPAEMLRNEGVRVEDNIADKEQQLVVEDLLALVGDID